MTLGGSLKQSLTAFALCFTLVSAAPAFAGYQDGAAAYKGGDFTTARTELTPLAEQGDAKAQFFLGIMHFRGEGGPQDQIEGEKWYRKAADQDLGAAQYVLGLMHENGLGALPDIEEAMKWYHRAADQGIGQAQYILGSNSYIGTGGPQNNVQALMWLELAVSTDNKPETDFDFMGIGLLTEDEIKEAKQLADAVARQLTPNQITEARQLVRDWKMPNETIN